MSNYITGKIPILHIANYILTCINDGFYHQVVETPIQDILKGFLIGQKYSSRYL